MEEVQEKLKAIQRAIPGILGFVLFTFEGFPIISTVDGIGPSEGEDPAEYLSAVGAGIVSLSGTTLGHMGISPMKRLIMESGKGYVMVERVDENVGMMVVATLSTSIGMAKMTLSRAIEVYRSASK